jgi:thiamine-monophosphate kinase
MLIEDVHFRRATHPPGTIGHKALARGLSDIAAMGATPRFCLVSLALAPGCDTRWVDGFYRGLSSLAERFDTALAGGDLSHAGKIVCDIVVCGAVPRGRALRRDTARPGDVIYVSGMLGGSTLGLATGKGRAWKRHLSPEPRIALGRWLLDRRVATAAMDLTDGLSLDLHRLCLASGAAAELQNPLPLYKGATLEQALHGGEDYELLFTARPRTRVPAQWQRLPLTRIGTIVKGTPGRVTLNASRLPPFGYDHFRADRLHRNVP